jgi:hypothetical protein
MVAAPDTGQGFDIGQTIGRTVRIIRQNLLRFTILTLVADLGLRGANMVRTHYLPQAVGFHALQTPAYWALFALDQVVDYCVLYILFAAMAHAASAINGRRVSILQCAIDAVRDAPQLCAIAAIAVIGFYGGFALLIIPGLFFASAWSVLVAVRTIERTSIIGTFFRSTALTRGHRWPILGVVLAFNAAATVAGAGVNYLLFAIVGPLNAPYFMIAWNVALTLLYLLTTIPIGVFSIALYFDLRANKEGIVPEQLAAVFD